MDCWPVPSCPARRRVAITFRRKWVGHDQQSPDRVCAQVHRGVGRNSVPPYPWRPLGREGSLPSVPHCDQDQPLRVSQTGVRCSHGPAASSPPHQVPAGACSKPAGLRGRRTMPQPWTRRRPSVTAASTVSPGRNASNSSISHCTLTRSTTYPSGRHLKRIAIPEMLGEGCLYVDFGKLKINSGTKITGCLKNNFALLQPKDKGQYHPVVHEIVHDINLALAQSGAQVLGLLDGAIGMETMGGPAFGRPKRCDILLAGSDLVAVDACEARGDRLQAARGRTLALLREVGHREHGLPAGDGHRWVRLPSVPLPVQQVRVPAACTGPQAGGGGNMMRVALVGCGGICRARAPPGLAGLQRSRDRGTVRRQHWRRALAPAALQDSLRGLRRLGRDAGQGPARCGRHLQPGASALRAGPAVAASRGARAGREAPHDAPVRCPGTCQCGRLRRQDDRRHHELPLLRHDHGSDTGHGGGVAGNRDEGAHYAPRRQRIWPEPLHVGREEEQVPALRHGRAHARPLGILAGPGRPCRACLADPLLPHGRDDRLADPALLRAGCGCDTRLCERTSRATPPR